LVLGPAWDGGYYLVGLKRPIPELFQGISWGGASVLDETLSAAKRLNLSVALLSPLPDVDEPLDLPVWCQTCRVANGPLQQHLISVVIPTLNEERHLESTLRAAIHKDGVEALVVDGGSTDRTPEIARDMNVPCWICPDGRAAQANLGAAIASGATLLILHADTLLPPNYPTLVRQALLKPGVAGGAFQFQTDDRRLGMRLVEWGANLRSRWFQRPYGDQALFTRTEIFWRVGGFAPWPILEDLAFAEALARTGRILTLPQPAVCSARRWQTRGVWRTFLTNQLVLLGYRLGVAPQTLAHWYRRPVPSRARSSPSP
jgi:rSAM/selenodomain-associated transferase 2